MAIKERVQKILSEIPSSVEILAATKERSSSQILEAIDAGIKVVGENYVREAESKHVVIGNKAAWHLIGHLQKNKVKRAVKIFDLIQTVDSLGLAQMINRECAKIGKTISVFIEVNSAAESQKTGVLPSEADNLAKELIRLENIRLIGLMTMGPSVDDPVKLRPYFREVKELFDQLKINYGKGINLNYLSMGMSSSYKLAVEEGANMIRLGTAIFGTR
ncbi:MAG: YggS family pyridoxal phosphate-dependent enzyme [Candidatus Omnitrophota bacterium]